MKEHPDRIKQVSMNLIGKVFKYPKLFDILGVFARKALKVLPRSIVYSKLNAWGKHRNLPDVPKTSFKEWYNKNRKKNG